MKKQSSSLEEHPDIKLNAHECDALFDLAINLEATHPEASAMLIDELGRALLHEPRALPSNTVVMNAYIDFVDESTGLSRSFQPIYPSNADISTGPIAILTPVGAGLIARSIGSSIPWRNRGDQSRNLRIVNVIVAAQVQADDNQ